MKSIVPHVFYLLYKTRKMHFAKWFITIYSHFSSFGGGEKERDQQLRDCWMSEKVLFLYHFELKNKKKKSKEIKEIIHFLEQKCIRKNFVVFLELIAFYDDYHWCRWNCADGCERESLMAINVYDWSPWALSLIFRLNS